MFDMLLLLIFGAVTWCVSGESAWGAAVNFLFTLLAAILAINYFEPLAELLNSIYADPEWNARYDMISLALLFGGLVFGFRAAGEKLVPLYVYVINWAHEPIRWTFAVLTGYVTMAFLLVMFHTAPVPREFLGFRAERQNLFNLLAPDRQLLGFAQYLSEHGLSRNINDDGGRPLHVFDCMSLPIEGYPVNDRWSSFPIRYAHRREQMMTGGMTNAATTAAPSQARPAGPVNPGF